MTKKKASPKMASEKKKQPEISEAPTEKMTGSDGICEHAGCGTVVGAGGGLCWFHADKDASSMYSLNSRPPLESDEVDLLAPEVTIPPGAAVAALAGELPAPELKTVNPLPSRMDPPPMNSKPSREELEARKAAFEREGGWHFDATPAARLARIEQLNAVSIAQASGFIVVNVVDRIEVELTEDEVNDRARGMISTMAERDMLEEERKDIAAKYKQELRIHSTKIAALRAAVQTKKEAQKVECVQVFDTKTERTWFLYRGKKTHERLMNDSELRETQRSLFKDAPHLPNKLNVDDMQKKPRAADEIAKAPMTEDDEETMLTIDTPDDWSAFGKPPAQVIAELESFNPTFTFSQNEKGHFVPKLRQARGVLSADGQRIDKVIEADGTESSTSVVDPAKPKKKRRPKGDKSVIVERAEGSSSQDIKDVIRSESSTRGKRDHAV